MAKALFGSVGLGADPRLTAEVRRLRERVRELEADLEEARAANAELTSAAMEHDLLSLTTREPALT